jgi:hypothetical protein
MAPPRPQLEPADVDRTRREVSAAFDRLAKALARHSIWLPGMDVDLVSVAYHAGRQAIQLGRVNDGTAVALTDALNRAEVG